MSQPAQLVKFSALVKAIDKSLPNIASWCYFPLQSDEALYRGRVWMRTLKSNRMNEVRSKGNCVRECSWSRGEKEDGNIYTRNSLVCGITNLIKGKKGPTKALRFFWHPVNCGRVRKYSQESLFILSPCPAWPTWCRFCQMKERLRSTVRGEGEKMGLRNKQVRGTPRGRVTLRQLVREVMHSFV